MYDFLFHAHSTLRFVVLFALVLATLLAFIGWFGKKPFSKANKTLNLVTLISTHVQVLFGLFLYFVSPIVTSSTMGEAMKDSTLRYWKVEHVAMMLAAAVLITIGNAKSKKITDLTARHRPVAIFFGLALLLIVVAILQSGRPLLGMSY